MNSISKKWVAWTPDEGVLKSFDRLKDARMYYDCFVGLSRLVGGLRGYHIEELGIFLTRAEHVDAYDRECK